MHVINDATKATANALKERIQELIQTKANEELNKLKLKLAEMKKGQPVG